jgi:hypothetical protein
MLLLRIGAGQFIPAGVLSAGVLTAITCRDLMETTTIRDLSE